MTVGVPNVPYIWHLTHLRELMIVLFKDRYMGHVVNLVGVKVKRSNFPF